MEQQKTWKCKIKLFYLFYLIFLKNSDVNIQNNDTKDTGNNILATNKANDTDNNLKKKK